MIAEHLFWLEFNDVTNELPIRDDFPNEHLFTVNQLPWYAHIVNYLVSGELPFEWSRQEKRKFLVEVRNYYWDDPLLFKYCPDQVMRRCIPEGEVLSILKFCHSKACGGHFSMKNDCCQDFAVWPLLAHFI